MFKKLLGRYKKAVENPEIVQQKVGEAQSVFSGFALKTCLIIFFIILILAGGYFISLKFNPKLLSLIEQQRLYQIVAEEIHQVPFEQLASSRFEKNIDGKNYVFTVIMDDSFALPVDMMGDTIPDVENPFISPWKSYILRSCTIEIMYLPENLFNLPVDAEPQIVKQQFFVIKLSNGDYKFVYSEPVMEVYNQNVKSYRDNLKRQAEEYIRKRDSQQSSQK